jgi:methyl-accepting chemotaxis protein
LADLVGARGCRQVACSTEIAGIALDEAQRTNTLVPGSAEAGTRIGDVVLLIKNIASRPICSR